MDLANEIIQRGKASKNLIVGVCSTLFSSWLGVSFMMMIVMTPPDEKINYKLAGVILCILGVIFLYGVSKLDRVQNYLTRKE